MINNFISGKKVVLFPTTIHDLDFFIKIYKENEGNLSIFREGLTEEQIRLMAIQYIENNKIMIWTAFTKMGKASMKIGCIFMTDINEFSCNMHGFVDNHYLKDLAKQMEIKYTYTEDCVNTLVDYCFDNINMERISMMIDKDNKLAYKLAKKCGFRADGILRKAIKTGKGLRDIAMLSIIKEERLNSNYGKSDTEEKPINGDK